MSHKVADGSGEQGVVSKSQYWPPVAEPIVERGRENEGIGR